MPTHDLMPLSLEGFSDGHEGTTGRRKGEELKDARARMRGKKRRGKRIEKEKMTTGRDAPVFAYAAECQVTRERSFSSAR